MQCLYTLLYQEEIQALNELYSMDSDKRVNSLFDISQLNIKDEFKLNFEEELKKSVFPGKESQMEVLERADGSIAVVAKSQLTEKHNSIEDLPAHIESECLVQKPKEIPY